MKALILSIILVFISSISMAYEPAPAIAAEDSQIIVNYLNDICGDTWCEGEYDLHFFNVEALEQAGVMKYYVHFAAKNSYEENAINQLVACEIKSSELLADVADDLKNLQYASPNVMAFDNEIDQCLQDKFYPQN